MQSIVCNPTKSEWNQHEVLNEINPKEDTRWRVMPYAFGDYILTCGEITYQSFGLDKNKALPKKCFIFWLPLLDLNQRPWSAVVAVSCSAIFYAVPWTFAVPEKINAEHCM